MRERRERGGHTRAGMSWPSVKAEALHALRQWDVTLYVSTGHILSPCVERKGLCVGVNRLCARVCV